MSCPRCAQLEAERDAVAQANAALCAEINRLKAELHEARTELDWRRKAMR